MSEDRRIITPAPSDRPTFTIKVAGEAVSSEYRVQSVVVHRMFNRVAGADIYILDGDPASQDFKVSNTDDFIPGKEIEVLAGYHSDEEIVFRGIVIRHGLRVFSRKPSLLRIECRDAAVKLTIGRKNGYFYEVTDSEVIEEIAGNAGLETEIEATEVTHAAMVQFHASDWDFIITRAEANGKQILTDNGKMIVKAPGGGDVVLNLTHGGNIMDFEAVMDARDSYDSVQTSGWDGASQEVVLVEANDPGATVPGNIASSDLAGVIGLEALSLQQTGVGDSELQAWANGSLLKSGYAKVRGRVKIQGFAGIKPGDFIALDGVGERFNGEALVAGVRHEISTRNWETDISFGLSPDWFGEHNRDVVDAPASGLLPGISGLHIALVTALEDPEGEDRVQLRLPMIDVTEEGVWARLAAVDAGEQRGMVFRPEIGDEVVVGFLGNDPRHPIILGMLNSSAKPAPITGSDDNHEKGIVTRSEMKVLFDDDKVSMTIVTPNGNTLVLSDDDGSVTIVDENGNTIVMNSDGLSMESSGDVTIKAGGDVAIEGTNVSLKASAECKVEGSAGAEISSGGSTTVKGSIVQIN